MTKDAILFDTVKDECMSWRRYHKDLTERFFDLLHENRSAYSPSLGVTVLYCEWMAGEHVCDHTFEVVYMSADEMNEHIHYVDELVAQGSVDGGRDSWTADILADFNHYSFSSDYEDDVKEAIAVIATICTAPDWTSDPRELFA